MAKKQKSVDAKVSAGPKLSKAERCKWDPAYCARVEALGAEGKSAPEIRRELGIPVSTWRAWVKKHPSSPRRSKRQPIRLKRGGSTSAARACCWARTFSAQTFIYLTKNIFPARFRDRQDHQITGANDGPIVQELRAPDLASIADPREALKQFEAFRASASLSPRRRPLRRSTEHGMAA